MRSRDRVLNRTKGRYFICPLYKSINMPRVNIIICLLLLVCLAFLQEFINLPGDANMQQLTRKCLFILVLLMLIRVNRFRLRLFSFREFSFGRALLPAIGLLLFYLLVRIDAQDIRSLVIMEGALPMVLLVMMAGTFAEELAFRFFIPANLSRMGFSMVGICIISSILFSLMHLLNLYSGEYDFSGVLNQVVFAFFMGILLFSIYYLGRSLLLSWIYHFMVNLPGRLSALQAREAIGGQEPPSVGDGLLESLVMLLLFSPLIIISLYYLRKIRKDDRVNHTSGNLAQSLFDP